MPTTEVRRSSEVETSLRRPTMPAEVLAAVRDRRRAEERAQADLLQLAVEWAVMHPAEALDADAAAIFVPGQGYECELAGPGAPSVLEFAVPEFAAAMGMSPDAGTHFLGEAIELRYRLPRLYARVVAGTLVAWRARRVAARTLMLSMEAAGFVDQQVAHVAHKIGPISLDRLVGEAVARFMPEEMERRTAASLESRHVTFHDQDPTRVDGTIDVAAALDLPDALDLQAAVTAGAAQRKALGSTDTLDVRRSQALGDLARQQPALPFRRSSGEARRSSEVETPEDRRSSGEVRRSSEVETPRVPARQVILYVHLSERALAGKDPVARVEQGNRVVSVDQVRSWCGRADTARLVVRPVLDLEACDEVDSDAVPLRHAELIAVRDRHCPLRVPVVHPTREGSASGRSWLRRRPHPPESPRRPDLPVQPGAVVPTTSPAEDPRRLDLHRRRPRHVPLDQPPRLPLSPRPLRHHRCRTPHRPRRLVDREGNSPFWQSRGVKRCRLHVTGASGSGTTTLGRVLAAAWGVPHADTDDYFWQPTSPPFTEKRAETAVPITRRGWRP